MRLNKSEIIAKVRSLVERIIEDSDIFLVDIEAHGTVNNAYIRVFVDTPNRITIDQCVYVSRELKKYLDMDNSIGNYTLEVSSPGGRKRRY